MGKLTVTNEVQSKLNRNIFGNFMEFLENHISGMWAEAIWNRKFEDIEDGCLPDRWYADNIRNRALCMVSDKPMSGISCVCMHCTEEKKGGDTALSQDGICARGGMGYTGSVWLRGEGLSSGVRVALGRNYGRFFQAYGEAYITGVTSEWKKYTFKFTSDASDDNATFSIRFCGTGRLWVDAVSLMPDDNEMGWRGDVVKAVRELKPGVIRFPGGCFADIYHWEKAIGDRDLRMPQDNYFWSDVPWDYKQSHKRVGRNYRLSEINDVGIDDFMNLCALTDTEPFICVNLGTGTAEEAAAWVEYCNGAATTEYGAKRAKNGHPEPYGIKIWQIGNEMYGAHEIGYSGLDGYIEGYRRFHAAMTAVDPSITMVADACEPHWNTEILRRLEGKVQYLDIHFYPGYNSRGTIDEIYASMFDHLKYSAHELAATRKVIEDEGFKDKVKIIVGEWNSSAGGWGVDRSFFATFGNALFGASLLHMLMRNCDIVEIGNFSNLTNAWWASCIRTNAASCHRTTSYHVLAMLANNSGDRLLKSEFDSGLAGCEGAPFADALATADGDYVALSFVNRTAEPLPIDLDLSAVISGEATAEYTVLTSSDLTAMNDFPTPDRVAPKISPARVSPKCLFTIPARSFSVLRIKK